MNDSGGPSDATVEQEMRFLWAFLARKLTKISNTMTALTDVLSEKGHRPFKIIFMTDEEIGADAEHVSMEIVDSEYGYTVDGGDYRHIAIESFTAYAMNVEALGKSIHPGSAKDKLVNASEVLMDFHESLPHVLRPEETADKELFITSAPCREPKNPPRANTSSAPLTKRR